MTRLVLATTLALAAACGPRTVLPTTTLTVGGHTVTAELAVDSRSRAEGLMYRRALGTDAGMLFVYPESAPRSFWMKNVPINLSIAFADEEGVIFKTAEMRSRDTVSKTLSERPAMYALEMAEGWFDQHAIKEGAKIEGIPKDLKPR